jgi:glucose-6-phosphate 1-dehydrogenase
MDSMPTELSAARKAQSEELSAYARLLTDAMQGDDMLFVREDAVEAAWSIVEPTLDNVRPVHLYGRIVGTGRNRSTLRRSWKVA